MTEPPLILVINSGSLAYIARRMDWSWDEMDTLLNKRSGLLGLSELSSDCRELQAAASNGHVGARGALDVFVHRLANLAWSVAPRA